MIKRWLEVLKKIVKEMTIKRAIGYILCIVSVTFIIFGISLIMGAPLWIGPAVVAILAVSYGFFYFIDWLIK